MERFEINMERVEELRDWARGNYPDGATILQGSVLKQDDQILWLGMAPCHVLWGAGVDTFCVYSPDCFGDLLAEVPCGYEAEYITDRAPVNPEESALPIFPDGQPPPPEQMQQADADDSERQMGGTQRRHKATLQEQRQAVAQVLAQLTETQREQATTKIRALRPELVAKDLGDHRHNAVPPPAGGGPKGDRD